jgi:hypothetical protein
MDYPKLVEITRRFSKDTGLSTLNYWELDKFIWVNGRQVKEEFIRLNAGND